jgi:hypothetical protein
MIPALTLAFFSGFVALSYEILWFRALNFTSGSTQAMPHGPTAVRRRPDMAPL